MDNIIRAGDIVTFLPAFGNAMLLAPAMVPMIGTGGSVLTEGAPTAIQGDEMKVTLPGIPYNAPPFVTPGVCMLQIAKLGPDQVSKKTKIMGQGVILMGSVFDAKLTVVTPAMQPTPAGPIPDPVAMKMGKGKFTKSALQTTDGG